MYTHPAVKTRQEITDLLERVDQVTMSDGGGTDEMEAIKDTLTWCLGHTGIDTIEAWFPEDD
jgi:hypothetical protein